MTWFVVMLRCGAGDSFYVHRLCSNAPTREGGLVDCGGMFFFLHIHACVFTLHIHADAFSHSGFSFGIPCECVYICFWHGGFCVVQIRIALTLCLFIWYVCVFCVFTRICETNWDPKGRSDSNKCAFFPPQRSNWVYNELVFWAA